MAEYRVDIEGVGSAVLDLDDHGLGLCIQIGQRIAQGNIATTAYRAQYHGLLLPLGWGGRAHRGLCPSRTGKAIGVGN